MKRKVGLKRERKDAFPKPIIYVVVEGEKTEYEYVTRVGKTLNGKCSHVFIKPIHRGTATKTMYGVAKEMLKTCGKDDEVWILRDVDDEGKSLKSVLPPDFRTYHRNKIGWAISNPCFEAWAMMHDGRFQLVSKDRKVFQHDAGIAGYVTGRKKKVLNFENFEGKCETACRESQSLRQSHQKSSTKFPDDNPSSTIDVFLIEVLEVFRKACVAQKCDKHSFDNVMSLY